MFAAGEVHSSVRRSGTTRRRPARRLAGRRAGYPGRGSFGAAVCPAALGGHDSPGNGRLQEHSVRWRGVQKLWGGPNSCPVMRKRLNLVMHLETPSDEEALKFGHAPGKLKQHRDARARRKAGEWNRGRWLETRTGRGACDNGDFALSSPMRSGKAPPRGPGAACRTRCGTQVGHCNALHCCSL